MIKSSTRVSFFLGEPFVLLVLAEKPKNGEELGDLLEGFLDKFVLSFFDACAGEKHAIEFPICPAMSENERASEC